MDETRIIDEFLARSDNGEEFEVIIYQDFLDGRSLSDLGADPIPGLKSARLNDGRALNFVDEDTFKIVSSGKLIRRVF